MAYPTDIINNCETDTATFKIKVNDLVIDQFEYNVAGITVNNCLNKIPEAKIIILDGDASEQNFQASASDFFIPGNKIEVLLGYENNDESVFSGIIIKHGIQVTNNSSFLIVEAKDAAVKLTIGRKNGYFQKKSDSDIIKDIIANYDGLQFGFDNIPSSIIHEEMVQYYSTDWDFIVSRAEAIGRLVRTHNGEISLIEPSSAEIPLINVTYGITVFSCQMEIDARDEFTRVVARTWNDEKREVAEKKSTDAVMVPEEGNLSGKELADVIGLDDFILQHPGKITDEEIDAWAKSKMMRSRLAKIKGQATIEGYAELKPGQLINVNQFSPRFNNFAFVSGITHQVTAESSWYTTIQFGFPQEWFTSKYKDVTDEPAAGLLPAVNGLMIGIIKDIDAVDSQLRVKVHIPFVNEGEDGIWARYAAPYAGQKRGVMFRPEVDDEVIIGFLNDDPREPIVLGSLHSSNSLGETPVTLENKNNIKGIYTRSEMKIEFDDDKQIVLIETPEGNKIQLSDKEDPAFTMEDKHGNKIETSKDGIIMESAKDFKIKAKDFSIDADNIEQKTKMEFKVDSTAPAEIKSSGILTIKGSLVDINP